MSEPSRAERIETMFTHAAELPEPDRARWLAQQRQTSPELVAEVEALLAAEAAGDDGFLARPLVSFAVDGLDEEGSERAASLAIVSVGVYRIVGPIGHGGMGEVYHGVHQPTGREAAIKLLRGDVGTRRSIERLRLEAQTLGRLNEPCIAQLFDAGVAETVIADGTRGHRPFIAMEYVDGRSITEFAKSHGLDAMARIALVERVARALQHAHQRGVIHRDLKPGNILVAAGIGSGPGEPKIVDFGIAKLVDESSTAGEKGEGDLTITGQILGTVRYMSPEQASGTPDGVDTRSDVYSLGAVLYELLAERPVIESQSGSALVIVGQVLTQRPPRLASLRRDLRGDIDAVVHKAIEREAKDRYQSAGDLADDLARLGRGEPVTARAPSAVERVVRSARRNKPLAAAIALAVLAMISGTAISLRMAYVADQRASEAIRERDRVRAARAGWSQALVGAQQIIAATSAQNSDFRAKVLENMQHLLERNESVAGRPIADRVYAIEAIAHLYEHLGEPAKALHWQSRAVALLEEAGRPEDSQLLSHRAAVASLRLKTDVKADVAECERIIADCRKKLADEMLETEPLMVRLTQMHALALGKLGRFAESEQVYKRLIDVLSESKADPDLLAHMQGLLGVAYRRSGRAAEAVPLLRSAIDGKIARHTPEIELALWYDNYGNALTQLLQHTRALEAYEQMYAIETRALGDQHGKTAETGAKLGVCLLRLGRADEAMAVCERSVATLRPLQSKHPIQLIMALNAACFARITRGELEAGDGLLSEARAALAAGKYAEDAFPAQLMRLNDGMLKRRRGELDQAESVLLATHGVASAAAEPWPPLLNDAASELAALYGERGDAVQAARWKSLIRP